MNAFEQFSANMCRYFEDRFRRIALRAKRQRLSLSKSVRMKAGRPGNLNSLSFVVQDRKVLPCGLVQYDFQPEINIWMGALEMKFSKDGRFKATVPPTRVIFEDMRKYWWVTIFAESATIYQESDPEETLIANIRKRVDEQYESHWRSMNKDAPLLDVARWRDRSEPNVVVDDFEKIIREVIRPNEVFKAFPAHLMAGDFSADSVFAMLTHESPDAYSVRSSYRVWVPLRPKTQFLKSDKFRVRVRVFEGADGQWLASATPGIARIESVRVGGRLMHPRWYDGSGDDR